MVRSGDGYVVYYYLSDGVYDSATDTFSAGWADAAGESLPAAGVEIPAGTAFWLVDQQSDSSTLTTPGAIVSDSTVDLTFGIGFTLAASPYPAAFAFSEITFTNLTGPEYDEYGNFANTAPQLMVRDGDGYVVYYYLADGIYNSSTDTFSAGWADAAGESLSDYTAKRIAAGTAFWVNLPSAGTCSSFTATFSL